MIVFVFLINISLIFHTLRKKYWTTDNTLFIIFTWKQMSKVACYRNYPVYCSWFSDFVTSQESTFNLKIKVTTAEKSTAYVIFTSNGKIWLGSRVCCSGVPLIRVNRMVESSSEDSVDEDDVDDQSALVPCITDW